MFSLYGVVSTISLLNDSVKNQSSFMNTWDIYGLPVLTLILVSQKVSLFGETK